MPLTAYVRKILRSCRDYDPTPLSFLWDENAHPWPAFLVARRPGGLFIATSPEAVSSLELEAAQLVPNHILGPYLVVDVPFDDIENSECGILLIDLGRGASKHLSLRASTPSTYAWDVEGEPDPLALTEVFTGWLGQQQDDEARLSGYHTGIGDEDGSGPEGAAGAGTPSLAPAAVAAGAPRLAPPPCCTGRGPHASTRHLRSHSRAVATTRYRSSGNPHRGLLVGISSGASGASRRRRAHPRARRSGARRPRRSRGRPGIGRRPAVPPPCGSAGRGRSLDSRTPPRKWQGPGPGGGVRRGRPGGSHDSDRRGPCQPHRPTYADAHPENEQGLGHRQGEEETEDPRHRFRQWFRQRRRWRGQLRPQRSSAVRTSTPFDGEISSGVQQEDREAHDEALEENGDGLHSAYEVLREVRGGRESAYPGLPRLPSHDGAGGRHGGRPRSATLPATQWLDDDGAVLLGRELGGGMAAPRPGTAGLGSLRRGGPEATKEGVQEFLPGRPGLDRGGCGETQGRGAGESKRKKGWAAKAATRGTRTRTRRSRPSPLVKHDE
mmetsp:Transcript_101684/g.326678  ORF Transcript_101684/g.326678 Transcript_101684/m.326678 type:complete len:552 (+) Transcript_101684:219-1874(+)